MDALKGKRFTVCAYGWGDDVYVNDIDGAKCGDMDDLNEPLPSGLKLRLASDCDDAETRIAQALNYLEGLPAVSPTFIIPTLQRILKG